MTRHLALVLGAVLLAACASMQNTPQQDYVYEMGRICEAGATSTKVERVAPDGRYWIGNTKAGDKKGDERKTFMSECLKADKKS